MIVSKFGGSSLADASQIEKVKRIVEDDLRRQIVIVSAPGKRTTADEKVTDLLYSCAARVQAGKSSKSIFDTIRGRYTAILSDLGMDEKLLDSALDEVYERIESGEGAHYAASRGEYLCARLVATYFGWEFLDTEGLIILADDGSVDPVTYANLKEAIDPAKRYIVPGFYGSNISGSIQTFSRGGSDITGAILSRAVSAAVYENWTDVSGIYSADPRLVEDAKVIKRMTYREVRELAGVGAGVFHEEAIAPVITAKIPINVKNTNAPADDGTWIVECREREDHPLVGVAAKGGFTKITLHKLMLFKSIGIRHGLMTMMRVFGVRPAFSLFGVDSIVWIFDTNQASDSVVEAMSQRLKDEFDLDAIEIERGCAVLGVVGAFVNEEPSLLSTVSGALGEAKIGMNFVNYGSSPISLLVGVSEEQAAEAVQVLYRALFA
jgi:aspartate kinase